MSQKIEKEELKSLQMKILDHIAAFCKEYDIHYSLAFGTLLGAVRHGGYIPWDDDIDIMMLREDYEKFLKLYAQYNSSEIFQLIDSSRVKNYVLPFAKIHDVRTLVKEDWQYADLGVNIDIFPIDRIANNKMLAKLQYWIIALGVLQINAGKSAAKKRVFWKKAISGFMAMFSAQVTCKLLNMFFCWTSGKQKYHAAANLFFWKFKQKRVPYSVFTDLIDIKFEDRMYKAIRDYDAYLSSIYGDYMTPPPVSQRQQGVHAISPEWK